MPETATKLLLITYLIYPILFGKDFPTIEEKTKEMKYHNSFLDIWQGTVHQRLSRFHVLID